MRQHSALILEPERDSRGVQCSAFNVRTVVPYLEYYHRIPIHYGNGVTSGTSIFAASFPGFSPTRPTERERERPWKTLVTCLPEYGRLQANDLGEGQVSVRFVSTERRQVSAARKLCTKPDRRKQCRKSFDSESVTSCRISGC